MKNKTAAWIVGIGGGEREYKIGDVAYTVSSNFEPFQSMSNLKERLERTIVSDFVPLTIPELQDTIADEYVCSGCIASSDAEKEEINAVEKEN